MAETYAKIKIFNVLRFLNVKTLGEIHPFPVAIKLIGASLDVGLDVLITPTERGKFWLRGHSTMVVNQMLKILRKALRNEWGIVM